jgi:hypothetical protein
VECLPEGGENGRDCLTSAPMEQISGIT